MILAFDTATDWLTIALGDPDKIIGELNEPAPRAHLNRLLPEIDTLLKKTGVELSDIEHIVVGIGPGSFTGVRIGVVTAQGLAHALGCPLIDIATLDAVALGAATGDTAVYPILDAKRREVYTAAYDKYGARLTDYRVVSPNELANELAGGGRPVLLVGDALDRYAPVFSDRLGRLATIARRDLWSPRASVLIKLAKERINEGKVVPFQKISPIYIRMSDAEEGKRRAES